MHALRGVLDHPQTIHPIRAECNSPWVLCVSTSSQTIRGIGVHRVVIDSVTHIEPLAAVPSALRSSHSGSINGLRCEGTTELLINEDQGADLQHSDPGRLSFIADAVILQRYVEIDSEMQRLLAVVKMRGSDHPA